MKIGSGIRYAQSFRKSVDHIVDLAWTNGEPGIIFLDRLNRDNPPTWGVGLSRLRRSRKICSREAGVGLRLSSRARITMRRCPSAIKCRTAARPADS